MLADVDLRSELVDLSVPMLRMYGRLDGLVPIKVASDLEKALPNSEQAIFTESSHAPFMTEREAFCQQIVDFCRK